MSKFLLSFHFIICVSLILVILAQRGKGSEMGVAFSSGSSSSVFGSQGSSGFLVKITTFLAGIFFINCLLIGIINKQPTNNALIKQAIEENNN